MSSKISKNETFSDGVINNTQSQTVRKSIAKKNKPTEKCSAECKKKRSNKPTEKGNSNEEEGKPKKTKRVSKKDEREPLKVLNIDLNTSKKDASASTKKNGVSAAKKRTTREATPPPAKENKKEKQNIPKIIVYQDASEKKRKKNKSEDKSPIKTRRSLQMTKSPSSSAPVRHTISVVPRQQVAGKMEKPRLSLNETKKSPAKEKPRLSKIKPGDPQFEEFFQKLETLFPDVDPDYLKSLHSKFKGSTSDAIEFIIDKEKTNELPSRDDYEKRLNTENLERKFLENFSVEKFIKIFPDPWDHFLKSEKHICKSYMGHSFHYLKNKYKLHYLSDIKKALAVNGGSLYLANKQLKRKNLHMRMRTKSRNKYECDADKPTDFNIQFLHEVAFIQHESKIRAYIKKIKTERSEQLKEASIEGTILECQSCNDASLLQDDAVNCPDNHVFCKDCVVKYVQVKMEKNNFQFKCLLKCDKKFTIESLQMVLGPYMIVKIIKRNQLEEIKSSGIENLVFCPLCFYVMVIPSLQTTLKCLNPSCMLEFCRYCKQPKHEPLKCSELEKLDASMLESELDEAIKNLKKEEKAEGKDLPLICNRCNGKFVKKENSIGLVCPCEVAVCSVCQSFSPDCPHLDVEASFAVSSSSDETGFHKGHQQLNEYSTSPNVDKKFSDKRRKKRRKDFPNGRQQSR